ncbi:glycerate kinase [Ornithinimicrobium pekingense]|uniref:Glycerate kinase n=1 Tax=Ornithinimicrobium pekingense TaxID=384677 RepID=A0ABQ2F8W3_9MICO|nr:glycerate kinase [Ornithinimicrobium pekingense]GGK73215.1 glycerate kinase [Ornithinimicrobium pekingense]
MRPHRPPSVVVAPDSFKGSLTAAEAAAAMARGARSALGEDAQVTEVPMADGGEGTLEALLAAWGAHPHEVRTVDALGRPRTGRWGLSPDGRTAVVEAAEGNGLPHVSDVPLQPLRADSHGVGLIARAVLDHPDATALRQVLLCVGGSASTDGGTGLLTGLGARFVDASGSPAAPGGAGLARVRRVDDSGLHPRAREVGWLIAVDVDNPLCGPRGAAAVFGPQKGADEGDVAVLDSGLAHLAGVLAEHTGVRRADLLDRAGLGAAGGLPLALTTLLGATLSPGAELVAEAVGLGEALASADVVLTGEGSLDEQSLGGKVVDAVRRLARPEAAVVVLAGRVLLTAAECRAAGLTAAWSIAPGPASLEDLLERAPQLLEDAAAHACAALAHRA